MLWWNDDIIQTEGYIDGFRMSSKTERNNKVELYIHVLLIIAATTTTTTTTNINDKEQTKK